MFDAAAEMLHESTKRPSTPVKTQIKYVFSSKYSFPLFAMFLLFNFAAMIFNSIAVHFIRDVLGNALYGIGLAFYGSLLFASTADVADHIIAILQNNASHPICQSVKYCVRNLCRASARLQISSLSFALCQIVLPALFY